MKKEVLDVLRQQFRPEFLNRIDEVVVFHSLSREHLEEIVNIQLERLRERLGERHIISSLGCGRESIWPWSDTIRATAPGRSNE